MYYNDPTHHRTADRRMLGPPAHPRSRSPRSECGRLSAGAADELRTGRQHRRRPLPPRGQAPQRRRQPVSFEIDDIDEISRAGWSVLVAAAPLVPATHEARGSTEDTMVQPWAPGEELYWMRIDVTEISGRRITPGKDRAWRPSSLQD